MEGPERRSRHRIRNPRRLNARADRGPSGFALTPNNFNQATFSVEDGVSGVLASAEPTATVTQLYAGYTCIAD